MNTLVIKKENLKYNIEQIKKMAEKVGKDDQGNYIKIIAVLKEKYGIDLIEYAKFLTENGINFFAVETIEEAIKLRESGIKKEEILMLSQTAIKEDIELLVKNNIVITLGSKEDVEIADKVGKEQKKKVRAHINVDTGIGTRGFAYTKREKMIEALKTMENIKIEGTYSEFVDSENDVKYTKLQFERFIDTIEILKMNKIKTGMLHICNSSAFLKFSNMNLNAIRIGKAFLGEVADSNSKILRKVAFIETKIAEIKQIPKGFYLGKSKIKKETTIAVIHYGRELKQDIKYISIKKQNCKILASIGNDLICDIGKNDIKVGEKIIFPIYIKNNFVS